MSEDSPRHHSANPPAPRLIRVTQVVTDEEIDHSYHRSLAQQQREIDKLTLCLALREHELAEERRQHDATRARLAATPRPPRRWEWALGGAATFAEHWPAVVTLIIAALIILIVRWLGGL